MKVGHNKELHTADYVLLRTMMQPQYNMGVASLAASLPCAFVSYLSLRKSLTAMQLKTCTNAERSERAHLAHVRASCTDPMFELKVKADSDTHPHKIDLGVGIYRDEEGHYQELKAVKLVSVTELVLIATADEVIRRNRGCKILTWAMMCVVSQNQSTEI